MTATYFAYSSELPPTTPPQSTYLDGASIVRTDVVGEDVLLSCSSHALDLDPTMAFCNPPSSSSYSCAQLLAPAVLPPPCYASPSSSIHRAFRPLSLRPTVEAATIEPAPSSAMLPGDVPKGVQMDMNMAATGSMAATAGIHTPLAQYAASMAVWLWFGDHKPVSPIPDSPMSTMSSLPHDPFEIPRHPASSVNPFQVHPSPQFTQFVSQLLQITMVSHSVTLVALLYIYRLKTRNNIAAGPGTEQRPFIASLILSNKYLDDNTYTNKTWAELTGLPVSEITKMEAEFLKGLNYDLAVHHSQYLQWRSLLDGFIFSRDAIRTRASQPQVFGSPQSILYTPNAAIVPSQPSDLTSLNMYRARSASPPSHSPPRAHRSHYPYLSPENPKKRTAVDAFAEPTTSSAGVYESMRRPARKATFVQPVLPTYPSIPVPVPTHSQPQLVSYPSTSSLTRSTSLNRQIARLPGEGGHGRRGSAGNIYSVEPEMDLRHAATTHAAQMHEYMTGGTSVGGQEYEGYSSLVAPYDRSSQLQMIPPEHLVFYTLAAERHPGQDGAPRKAILRYQDPSHPFVYPELIAEPTYPVSEIKTTPIPDPTFSYGYAFDSVPSLSTTSLTPDQRTGYLPSVSGYAYDVSSDTSPYVPYSAPGSGYTGTSAMNAHSAAQGLGIVYPAAAAAEPEPAQFANNGPPGYTYDPHTNAWANRWSTGSEEMLGGYQPDEAGAQMWRTRSEWSSPMPTYDGWRG